MSTLRDTLVAARDSLTEETWIKGNFFRNKNKKLCMCSHGALQVQVNPEVRQSLQRIEMALGANRSLTDAATAAVHGESDTYAFDAAYIANDAIANNACSLTRAFDEGVLATANKTLSLASKYIWENRSDWIRTDSQYGSREVHYLLGMVGLTAAFNDHQKTTLEMIKEKFNQAIALAEELGV